MATLLKRLSFNMDRRAMGRADDGTPGGSRSMASSTSFSDFSMHVGQDVEEHHTTERPTSAAAAQAACMAAQPHEFRPSPFIVGSAPAGSSGFGGLPASAALRIPRSSVAHLLSQRTMAPAAETPRSSLDLPAGSAPTPRSSLSIPRSPRMNGTASVEEPASPRSPRSPTTPGGRRRKSQKIDGMDYYEFCELIRSSSL